MYLETFACEYVFLRSTILHINVTNKILLYFVLLAFLNMNFTFSCENIVYLLYLQVFYMGIVLFGPGIALEAGKCKNDNHTIPNLVSYYH